MTQDTRRPDAPGEHLLQLQRMGTGARGQPTRSGAHIRAARLTMTVAACVLLAAAMFSQSAFSHSATSSRHAPDAVPARPVTHTFAAFSDESLWKAIVATGRVAVVGLKNPGAARGIWQQHILLSPDQWRRAREAVLAAPGITLVSADVHLPLLTVRVADLSALRRLRQLPDVDYLEPLSVAPRVQSDSGCLGFSGGGLPMWPYPGSYSVPTPTAARPLYDPAAPAGMSGNMIPWNFWYHNIPQAWSVASGAGITVGVVDTGVFQGQTLLQPAGFNGGASSGRTVVNLGTKEMSSAYDQCGHGTRVAGTIAAPRNFGCPLADPTSDPTTLCKLGTGLNIVGAAWNANLVTVRTMDHVVIEPLTSDETSVQEGIEDAYEHGARIINLSVGFILPYNAITDEINLHLNNTLFVAAAGTGVCRNGLAPNAGVVYPAATPGVLAVTGVNPDGTLHSDSCWGPEVSLGVVVGSVPATGQNPRDIIEFGATSDAAAVTSGIAALIWSKFPALTPYQVKDRLLLTAKPYSSAGDWGHGSPDAYAAVTAPASSFIQVPNVVGLLAANAISAIRSAGLVPIEVSRVDTLCNNIGSVINQSPGAVDLALPGSSVTITVAVKPPNPCP